MRITKRQLIKIIREERQGYDDREDERLGDEHGPAADHEQDYHDRRDDAEFEERHARSHSKDHQGYDDREDERLGAEHGAEDDHEQDYHDRRDDAGFERRHESVSRRISKSKIRRIVRENTRRPRRIRRRR